MTEVDQVDLIEANPVIEKNHEMASARMKFVQFRPDASSNYFLLSYLPGSVGRDVVDTKH
jgi:nucleoid-associated protein YejK